MSKCCGLMNTIFGMASRLIDIVTTIQKDQKEGPSGHGILLLTIWFIYTVSFWQSVPWESKTQTKNGR